MNKEYDVCIIGSGAGAGPIAYELAKAGKKVVILEKGKFFNEEDFSKDEIATCRREKYSSHLKDEFHVIEDFIGDKWISTPTKDSGWSFWNGNVVGGSSNFMSGYFHRIKPIDFRLKSEFGSIEGANIEDWPIDYNEMEPYFDKVEKVVGVSGKIVAHKHLEPRSSEQFPFDALIDHPISHWLDTACEELDIESIPMPRAIITKPLNNRKGCVYSVYCGSYACDTGAKGSSRAALINQAIATNNCEVRAESMVFELLCNDQKEIKEALYYNKTGEQESVKAKYFVVAAQAIETCRLLLNSKSDAFPKGLANNSEQVGKNLLFTGGGMGSGEFDTETLSDEKKSLLKVRGPFINRAIQEFYSFQHPTLGNIKGGTIDFLHEHPNPIRKANNMKWNGKGKLLWGKDLQDKVKLEFDTKRNVNFEVFADWLPNDNCFVAIDPTEKDKWGIPVAKVRIAGHEHDLVVGEFLIDKAKEVLKQMGATKIRGKASSTPSANLQAGGCRFGDSPETSVLDRDCKAHEVSNLFVTDGSFMPTGGSVTYTWTIYANSFRVADILKKKV